jgi:hypothetical protein
MTLAAKAENRSQQPEPWQNAEASRTLLAICGSLIGSVGIVLTTGAALSAFEQAPFALAAGCGLMLSGAYIVRGRRSGAFALMALTAATTAWSLSAGHLGSAPLSARLFGPAALLLMTALLLPPLLHIRPLQTIAAFVALVALIALIGSLSSSTRSAISRPAMASSLSGHPSQRIAS